MQERKEHQLMSKYLEEVEDELESITEASASDIGKNIRNLLKDAKQNLENIEESFVNLDKELFKNNKKFLNKNIQKLEEVFNAVSKIENG